VDEDVPMEEGEEDDVPMEEGEEEIEVCFHA